MPLRTTKGKWSNPRFSPDGKQLAFDLDDGKRHAIWIYGWSRDVATPLTFGAPKTSDLRSPA